MHKVRNRKVISRLSARIVSARGKKNLVTILAIMLTTVLFTALFTIGSSMIESIQESTMRQVGGSSMSGVKFILPKDYEKLSKDSKVKNASYRIIVGHVENEELLKLNTEVNFAEDENAKGMFCYPKEGTMPKEKMEIATSTLVLDALGIPHKVGEKVTLKIAVNGKHITDDFTLSGFWEGDSVAMAQECFVSREYCEKVAPTPEKSFYESLDINYAGYWMMDFNYANSWDIEEKTIALLERNGYDINQISYGVNWAYTTSKVDGGTIVFIVAIMGLILASGYLIIYNIFSLNVAGDIKSYGLLKTIGTTELQLKQLVRRQAVFLSVIGIPAGLVAGVLIGSYLFPVITKNFELGENVNFSIHPLVMMGAAAFSFFTVWVSCNKPCKLAAKVSPVEAVRYTDKSNHSKIRERKTRKVTAISFAWANLGRNRKKVAVVVASLSLSMILLNSVYTMVRGFDMDKYVSYSIVGDAIVSDSSILNLGSSTWNTNGVTPQIQEALDEMEGVGAVHNIYFTNANIKISDKASENFMKFVEESPQYFSDLYAQEELSQVRANRIPWSGVYGVDSWGMEQLEFYKGEPDWEKFKTGKYCLLNTYGIANGFEEPLSGMYSDVGEKISIELNDGTVKEYEVLAIAEVPYAMSSRFFSYLGLQVILPEQEYKEFVKPEGALLSVLFQEENTVAPIDTALEHYTNQIETNLMAVTKATYEKEFEDCVNMFWIVGGSLSLILALIGILNFINAVVTGILARKQELAMMEAVGMTGKQMKRMLFWEGILYASFTMVVSGAAVLPVNKVVLEMVVEGMWFFNTNYTIVPIMLCMPVLLAASGIIPILAYQNMKRESVVERLRETE